MYHWQQYTYNLPGTLFRNKFPDEESNTKVQHDQYGNNIPVFDVRCNRLKRSSISAHFNNTSINNAVIIAASGNASFHFVLGCRERINQLNTNTSKPMTQNNKVVGMISTKSAPPALLLYKKVGGYKHAASTQKRKSNSGLNNQPLAVFVFM